MNEEQVRSIVQDEINKNQNQNYNSGSPSIPPHVHDGNDNLNINPLDLIGWDSIPSTNRKYLTPSGTYIYGFASPNQLTQGISGTNQYIGNFVNDAGLTNGTLATYPIPLVIGNGVGNAGSFNGGYAPDGTLIAFITGDPTTSFLYLRWDGQWFGVQLSATPVTP